jgi:hypothetical protein
MVGLEDFAVPRFRGACAEGDADQANKVDVAGQMRERAFAASP